MIKLRQIRSFVHFYLSSYTQHFNVVQRRQQNKSSRFRRFNHHYLYGAAIVIYTFVYGMFGLVWESDPKWTPLDLTAILASRYQFLHQVLPRSMWKQMEIVAFNTSLNGLLTVILLYFKSPIPEQNLIHPDKVKKSVYQLMQKYYHSLRFVLKYVIFAPFYCLLLLYFYVNLYLNGSFKASPPTTLYWSFIFPQYIFHLFICQCIMPFYLVFTSICVRFQQRFVIDRLAKLNRKLNRPNSRMDQKAWCSFLWLNRRNRAVCADLSAYAWFWSDLLTLAFAFSIIVQCYVAYSFIFLSGSEPWSRALYCMVLAEFAVMQALLIRQCALVVSMNGRLLRQNRHFLTHLLKSGTAPVTNLFKAESLHEPLSLRRYAFEVLGNKRITSRTFIMLVSYIITLFLYVCKDL